MLLNHDHVKEAAVTVKKDAEGQGRLAAYIAPKVTAISLLCQSIMQELPAYMMPSHIIGLDSMPLALNGKLDKSALPAGEIHSAQTSNIMFHRFRSPLKKAGSCKDRLSY
ncbi:AMP-binding enzyme [Bacillus amyloliquefaciens]|uniref:AMP-binding enzyme n=1 Tax=Bacillus amyloliquefaciens TaxID=1390 RepID=UPI001EDFB0AF|nr:hypothetical protein [Bacillus amyloliquefaciens]